MARRGDYRLEEPRAQEGVRSRPGADQIRSGTAGGSIKAGGLAIALPWVAIWTRSPHEQGVREQLEKKRIDAFLPTIPRWSRWKDRKKKIDWPLFPGYCFARFAPAH